MNVLVVDDDPVIAQLIQEALVKDGYVVRTATSFAQARQMRGPFDIVLADIRLPNGDGRHLREHYPDTHFVSMSGLSGEKPSLPKPFTIAHLRQAILDVVNGP